MVDLYAILGVVPGADAAAIRAAYRRLARQFHPDVNRAPEAAVRMRAINAAYETLSDPCSRSAYDAERFSAWPGEPASMPAAVPVGQPSGRPAVAPAMRSGASARTRFTRAAVPASPAAAWRAISTPPTVQTAPHAPVVPAAVALARRTAPVTMGVVAGLLALVALFGAWAVVVSRPARPAFTASASARSAPYPRSTSSAAVTAGRADLRPAANASANASAASANAATAATKASANNRLGAGSGASATAGSAREGSPPVAGAAPGVAATNAHASAPLPPLASSPIAAPAGVVPGAVPVLPEPASVSNTVPAGEALGVVPPLPQSTSVPDTGAQSDVSSAGGAAVIRRAPAAPAAMPAIPVVPSGSAAAVAQPHIQAVAGQQVSEPPSVAAATRALSAYDKAWTNYVNALRWAAAGSLASSGSAGVVTGAGAATLLSGDGQLGLLYGLYLDARANWGRQMSNTLAAMGPVPPGPRPDGDRAARADQHLRQAHDLIRQAQSTGRLVAAAPVRLLLDEAEQLHRAWVADWANYLAGLAG